MDAGERVVVLMREYEALYQLVIFRMTALDRRLPVATTTLTAFLASVPALPPTTQLLCLLGLPLALVWLLRTTVNHARSFEDVVRRIDEIERQVNDLAGQRLLAFQSEHPSKGVTVGGRTGRETIRAVFTACVMLLLACGYLFTEFAPDVPCWWIVYGAYLLLILLHLVGILRGLRGYAYARRQPFAWR